MTGAGIADPLQTEERHRGVKTFAICIAGSAFLLGCALAAVGLDLRQWSDRPMGTGPGTVDVTVPAGQGMRAIADTLHREGLVDAPLKLTLLARFLGSDKRIQAGEYRLSADLSPRQLLAALTEGKVRLHRITVPEGYNLVQIAQRVAESGFGSAAAFAEAAADPALLAELGISADSFEGYLFPDTYFFSRTAAAPDIIRAMVRRYRSVFTDAWRARARALGLTEHQVVTLASIVEKETAIPAERPLVASVYHNRLRRNMRLEADPTVIYGIAEFDGNLTREHLNTPTPYNTYQTAGLPPGPIASPGAAALEAALFPADTPYLFFVARKDRSHVFSTTYRDHQRAVREHQLRR
jgi:UPF0755 protein